MSLRQPTPPSRSTAARFLQWLVVLLGAALAASQLGGLHYMLDNLSNFLPQFSAAFALCAAALAALRDFRWAAASAVGAVLAFAPVWPWYLSDEPAPRDATTAPLKLLVSNVYFRNDEHARLIRVIEEERPDVIGLVEVTPRWLRKLEPIHAAYPWRFELPDEGYVGLALFSRLPLTDTRVLRLGGAAPPAIAATLSTPDGPVELVLAHAATPVSGEFAELRNAQVRALARFAVAEERPLILAGDLNLTMWNRNYRPLAEAGLVNARQGHGIGASWPAGWPLGVPIDHILATPAVQVRNFRVLGAVGSDHLPVSAEFSAR